MCYATARATAHVQEQNSPAAESSSTRSQRRPPPMNLKRSYPREYKLKAIQYYKTTTVETKPDVWKKIPKRFAAKKLGITPSMLRDWLANKTKILQSLSGTRWIGSGRKVEWPEMESRPFAEFTACRAKGRSINHQWFLRTAKRLFNELYPTPIHVS